jgi:hypothetical protein
VAISEIQIFNTVMLIHGNKTVSLLNGALSNSTIFNYRRHGNRLSGVAPATFFLFINLWLDKPILLQKINKIIILAD